MKNIKRLTLVLSVFLLGNMPSDFYGQTTATSTGQSLDDTDTKLNSFSSGSGKPVVFIHGSYGSLQDFKMSVFNEVSKTYKAVAIDMPGHGKSGQRNTVMTLEDHADTLHSFLAGSGIKKPLLVGHSWGGAAAIAYALKYPDKVSGLVLLSAYTAPYESLDLIYRVTTTPVIGDLFVLLAVQSIGRIRNPASFLEKAFYPDNVPDDYAKMAVSLAIKPSAFKSNAEDVKSLGPSLEKMRSRYPEIKVPVIIVTGDMDKIAPAERHAYPLHETIPHSKLILLPKTGHQPAFTKPHEVMKAIDIAWTEVENNK
jgi:pimeloyl-ACP methyl ester carboxylesterase